MSKLRKFINMNTLPSRSWQQVIFFLSPFLKIDLWVYLLQHSLAISGIGIKKYRKSMLQKTDRHCNKKE